MSNKPRKRSAAALATGAALVFGVGVAGAAGPGISQGPSTSVDPYVIPVDPTAVTIASLLTVDNTTANSPAYPMAGIPDGLGAYVDGQNVVLLSNHELGNTSGIVRSHGVKGAFQSKWTVDPVTSTVTAGADLITTVDYAGTSPAEFARFCSADLATSNALFNTVTGNGYNGNLFMTGEETGLEGRAVASDPLTGNAYVLPALGRTSFESVALADTSTSDTTLAIGLNDSSTANQTSNLVYVGTKTNTGTPVQKAGLTGGTVSTIKLASVTTDAAFRTTYGVGNPQPFTLAAITGATGAALQADSVLKGGFQPDRTEDGSWDPSHPNDFYFLTTGSTTAANGRGGLWRMRWTDRTNPTLGGTLTLLVNNAGDHLGNSASFYMPDNLTVDGSGHVLIQEDPGNDAYLARVWAYDIATNVLKPIATFDPSLFSGATPITLDEESSGIIPAPSSMGANTYLFDAQVHTATGLSNAARDVERGQYLKMTVDWTKVFPTLPADVPEVPVNVLLPLSALAIGGAAFGLQRRRARA